MPRTEVVPLAYVERFVDGLGSRYLRSDEGRDTVEILRLCRDLASMRTPVADRVERQATLRLAQFVPVRSVGAPPDDDFAFEVVSDHVPGARLSEILKAAAVGRLAIPGDTAFHIVRQLLGALSSLHLSRGVAHGALAPERVLITDKGHVLLADHVLGQAIERLEWNRPRLWRELGVPTIPGEGTPRLDEHTDLLQVGVIAIALLAGRPLAATDYPARLPAMIDTLSLSDERGRRVPMARPLKAWLRTVLWIDAKSRPASAREALASLETGLVDARRPRQAGRPAKDLIDAFLRLAKDPEIVAAPAAVPAVVLAAVAAEVPADVPAPTPVVELPEAVPVVTLPVRAPAPAAAAAWVEPVPPPAAELLFQPVASTVVRDPDIVTRKRRRDVSPVAVTPSQPRGAAWRSAVALAGSALRHVGSGSAALGAGLWRVAAGTVGGTASLLASLADGAVRGTLSLLSAVAAVAAGTATGVARMASGGARGLGDVQRAVAGAAAGVVAIAGRGGGALVRAAGSVAAAAATGVGRALRGGAAVLALGARTLASGTGRALMAGAAGLATGIARAVRGADGLGAGAIRLGSSAARLAASLAGALAVGSVAVARAAGRTARVAWHVGGAAGSGAGRRLAAGTRQAAGAAAGVTSVSAAAVTRMAQAVLRAADAVAASATGSRAVVLPMAQAVRRAGSLEVSRQVVCASLFSVIAWPGIELARAQWQDVLDPWSAYEAAAPAAVAVPARVVTTGGLRLTTDPAGAQVWLDGKLRGGTPLALAGLRPGRHTVVVRGPGGSVKADVRVAVGETTEVALQIFPGWLAVFATAELQVLKGGASLGTTEGGRFLLAPGSHDVELVSERLGFRDTRTVEILPGGVTVLNVDLPPAPIEIVAPDGAEVWVDGRSLGVMPLPPQSAAVGTCEVVIRHPELGEFRQPVTITYRTPTRIVFEGSR